MTDAAPSDDIGHRSRVRDRLLEDGEGLLDHELLEYLLGLAIKRGDTKPLAKLLIREFGSFAAAITADSKSLLRVTGMGPMSVAAIKIAHTAAIRLVRSEVVGRPVLGNWQALLDYLRADMVHHPVERVRVLYLDAKNRLLRDEMTAKGTVDQAPVYIREVIKRALELVTSSLILVHNHPSGDPSPSRADIDITRAIIDAGKPMNIAVHDHLIMGTDGHVSLRARGLI